MATELIDEQTRLAAERVSPWRPSAGAWVGGCFVCFERGHEGPGRKGDHGWAAAVAIAGGRLIHSATASGPAGAPYEAGLLALREGPLLEEAVLALSTTPDLLLVNATGRDHPRRGGLALHLGAILGLPTVGVTHRPLLAHGGWPSEERGAMSPLHIDGELVGFWVRTQQDARPLVAHAGWCTSAEQAAESVLGHAARFRTPEPIRQARRLAREARMTG